MSVLIKGMKIPKDCPMCPMAHFNKLDRLTGCDVVPGKRYIKESEAEYWQSDKRPNWCPLIPVTYEEEIINALNNKWYGFPDQDCTNELCEGRILPLEGRYNISRFTEPDTETYIRHYAAQGLPMQEYVKYTRGVNNGQL